MVDKGKGKQKGLPAPPPFAPKGKGKSKSKNWNLQSIKTKRFTNTGREICKPFNDQRDCRNPACSLAHCCDVQLSDGTVCASVDHSRATHTGPTLAL
eukprot:8064855-Karenia_brevis.AAC.1